MMSRLAYDRIDRQGSDARIRLNSTVVSVRHLGDPEVAREVEITYVRDGRAEKVRADHCVMACYNGVIPYLVPELSDPQREALMYGVKMPIVYTNVLIRRWTAFSNLGISRATSPGMYHTGVNLGRSVQFRRLPTLPIARRPDNSAHDQGAMRSWTPEEGATSDGASGSTGRDLRDLRAQDPGPTRSEPWRVGVSTRP